MLVDSTGSEIRRGSRRPIGRVSTAVWKKLSKEEKAEWAAKLKAERNLAKKFGFDTEDVDDAFVKASPSDPSGSAEVADDEAPTPFDRPDRPAEVPKGRARYHSEVASKRKQKRSKADLVVPSGPSGLVGEVHDVDEDPVDPFAAPLDSEPSGASVLVATPESGAADSRDPRGSSHARGHAGGKSPFASMGVFGAIPPKWFPVGNASDKLLQDHSDA